MNRNAMNKKKCKVIFTLFLFAVLLVGLAAGVHYYNVNEAPAVNPSRYLYRVTKGDKALYLLGAHHYGVKPPILDDAFEKAYAESEIVVFEVRMDRYNEEFNFDTYKLNPISQIAYPALTEQFEKIKRSYNSITDSTQQYSASYIQALATNEALNALSWKGDYGVDIFLFNMALRDHKNIGELETIAEREAMTSAIDRDCPNYLLNALDNKKVIKENFLQSFKAYADGTYIQLFNEDFSNAFPDAQLKKEAQTYLDIVLYHRNDRMYERALAFMQDEVTLVVVGVDHLLGERGLLEQFEQNGYAVHCLAKPSAA